MLPSPGTSQHLKVIWDVVYFLHFGMRAAEGHALLGNSFSTVSSTNTFNSSKVAFTGRCYQSTHHTRDAFAISKVWQGSSVTFRGNWSYQLNQTYHVGPPEVLMKNGNRRQLFSLRTLSPLLHERALSNASFSWTFAWMSSPPGTDTPVGQADLSSLELQRKSGPLRRRVQSERNGLCHSCFTIIVLLFFVAPEKKQHKGGPQPQPQSRPWGYPA